VITAPNSDLNVTDGQTDGHCGITAYKLSQILSASQRYRYMACHYSLAIRQAIRQSTQGSVLIADWVAIDRGLGSTVFFYGRQRSAHQSFIGHNTCEALAECPAEKQTMQQQARAACASAVHVISADPFLNGSNTCGIPRIRN